MSRTAAREHIFKIVYELPFQNDEIELLRDRYLRDFLEEELSETDKDFIIAETEGVVVHLAELDRLIAGALQGWKINRLSKVDLAILRLAVYELRFAEDMPVSVSINEAVELAKKYSQDNAPAFINGILATVAAEKPVNTDEKAEDEQ